MYAYQIPKNTHQIKIFASRTQESILSINFPRCLGVRTISICLCHIRNYFLVLKIYFSPYKLTSTQMLAKVFPHLKCSTHFLYSQLIQYFQRISLQCHYIVLEGNSPQHGLKDPFWCWPSVFHIIRHQFPSQGTATKHWLSSVPSTHPLPLAPWFCTC